MAVTSAPPPVLCCQSTKHSVYLPKGLCETRKQVGLVWPGKPEAPIWPLQESVCCPLLWGAETDRDCAGSCLPRTVRCRLGGRGADPFTCFGKSGVGAGMGGSRHRPLGCSAQHMAAWKGALWLDSFLGQAFTECQPWLLGPVDAPKTGEVWSRYLCTAWWWVRCGAIPGPVCVQGFLKLFLEPDSGLAWQPIGCGTLSRPQVLSVSCVWKMEVVVFSLCSGERRPNGLAGWRVMRAVCVVVLVAITALQVRLAGCEGRLCPWAS